MITLRRTPGRHAALVRETGRRPAARRTGVAGVVSPTSIAATAAAILLGVLAAVGGVAGSYAYLNASAPTTAGSTVTAGTTGITLQSGAGIAANSITLAPTAWTKMLPGDFAGQNVTIANTGDTTLSISTRLSASVDWNIRVASGACPATQLATGLQSTSASTLATINSGGSLTVCVQAILPTTAPNSTQGTNPLVSLLVDGTQIP